MIAARGRLRSCQRPLTIGSSASTPFTNGPATSVSADTSCFIVGVPSEGARLSHTIVKKFN